MRRIPLLLLSLLLALSLAAASVAATGDGSLVVTGGSARSITVQGSGLIFGHITQGTLTLVEYMPDSGNTVQVSGSMMKLPWGATIRYAGSDIRFLFPNGHYTLRLDGFGIDVSAVGKGQATAIGLGTGDHGTMASNGDRAVPLGPGSSTLSFGGGNGSSAGAASPVKESSH